MPEPVPPTKITRPRLVIATSFSTGGRPRSSNFGIVVVMVRSTMPTRCLLHEGVDAEAADARRADREVALLGGLELRRLLVVHDAQRASSCGVLRRQRLVGHRRHLAVDLDRGRKAGGDEQVGGLLRHHRPQQIVHEFDCLISFHSCSCLTGACCQPVRKLSLFAALPRASSDRHDVALDQVLQVLVERLHADALRRSGSPNTSAPPWPRGSGCGSPACRS